MYKVLTPTMANAVRVDKVLELESESTWTYNLIEVENDFHRVGVQQFREGLAGWD